MLVIITGILTQCRREFKYVSSNLIYSRYHQNLASSIQLCYQVCGTVPTKCNFEPIVSNNMCPRKIVWWIEAYLEALLRFYPTIYLWELQEILANNFQLGTHGVPFIAAIARLFTKLKMCKKCVHVTKERMSPHNRYCCQLYFQWRRTIDPTTVVVCTTWRRFSRRSLIGRL